MLQIVKNNIRQLLSRKGSLFVTIILPVILFCLSLILFNTDIIEAKWNVAVVDEDDSMLSANLCDKLGDGPNILSRISREEVDEALSDSIYDLAVIIPSGFEAEILSGGEPQIAIRSLKAQEVSITYAHRANQYINGLVSLMGIKEINSAEELIAESDKMQTSGLIFKEQSIGKAKDRGGLSQASGFLVYVISISMFIVGELILSEKRQGTLNRIRQAPVKKLSFVFATFITGLCFLIFNLISIFIVTNFIIPVEVAPIMYVLWLFYGIAWTFIAMFFALTVSSSRGYSALSTILSTIFAMLGGSYWPYWLMPEFLQKIAMITPQYWTNTAIYKLLDGKAIVDITGNLIALVGFAMLGAALCTFALRRGKSAEAFV
ncbi:MAG: ABC transporter permease [Christensenellales bacterium]|nr:ABC transporter permease [Christensenellaceae bacterium]